MAQPPTVRVNSFVRNEKSSVDNLSKIFIISETLLGLNRIVAIGEIKSIYVVLSVIYVLFLNIAINYMLYYDNRNQDFAVMLYMKMVQYVFCSIFGFITWKRMQRYYAELDKYDKEIGGRSKLTTESIVIVVQLSIITIITIGLFIFKGEIQYIPVHLIYIVENHYYAYLLNLLFLRLRLINDYVESSMDNAKFAINSKTKDFIYSSHTTDKKIQFPMSRLMDLYQILINAFDLLIDAIKWQFLVILTISFLFILAQSFSVAMFLVNNDIPGLMSPLPYFALALTEMIALFAPCICCDQVRAQVRRLRELLASRLYENKLDKSGRSIARALLALTETRDLSFSLLRVVNISVSLPFTFMGLLVTYLIILLQFQKVGKN